MKDCGIYKITNSITRMSYIGQSFMLTKRKVGHFNKLKLGKHVNKYLQYSFNKYGIDNFIFEVLLYCEPFELTRYEQWFVNNLKPEYNICKECVDSRKGTHHTQETKEKLSLLNLGKIMTNVSGLKISQSRLGTHLSEETKKKISQAHVGKKKPQDQIRKMIQTKTGTKLTEEHKKKISESMIRYCKERDNE